MCKCKVLFIFHFSRELAETSPYFESLKKRDQEVLFCYEMYDELVLLELKEFARRPLISVENDMQKDSSDTPDPVIGKLQKYSLLACWCFFTLIT